MSEWHLLCVDLYYSKMQNTLDTDRTEINVMKERNGGKALKKLGFNIKQLRKSKGLSQDQLSVKTGLHRTYISQIERGINNPTILNLNVLANGLEVDLEMLIKEMFCSNKDVGASNGN